jgi:hypothetical protein
MDPGAEDKGRRDEVRLHAVHILQSVAERAAEIRVELSEAHVGILAKLGRRHDEVPPPAHRGETGCAG